MTIFALHGRSILVLQNEYIVGLDIRVSLEAEGASVTQVTTYPDAWGALDRPGISGAIVDFKMSDSDSLALCAKLEECGVPFVVYTGWPAAEVKVRGGVYVGKPALPEELIKALVAILPSSRTSGGSSSCGGSPSPNNS